MTKLQQLVLRNRVKSGLSTAEVARRCKVSRTTICMIENGSTVNPTFSTMYALCMVLGINTEDMYKAITEGFNFDKT